MQIGDYLGWMVTVLTQFGVYDTVKAALGAFIVVTGAFFVIRALRQS